MISDVFELIYHYQLDKWIQFVIITLIQSIFIYRLKIAFFKNNSTLKNKKRVLLKLKLTKRSKY